MEYSHQPVLLEETVRALNIKPDGVYIDCTVGGGGHSAKIAARLDFTGGGGLICFDRDTDAIGAAQKRLSGYPVRLINGNFADMADYGITGADGILMDLGVSSHQLDSPERGFSFHMDAPLDMRMGDSELSAYDVANGYSEGELVKILFEYGEEKYARGITRGIIAAREKAPIKSTRELAEIIKRNVPLSVRGGKNPCRKTFQAIRIEVNDELRSLAKGLEAAFGLLNIGGRMAIITFHSLEDRRVKNAFAELAAGCDCPKNMPLCVCGKTPAAALITRKPITPGERELSENRRARSAKLRVIEKLKRL
ncbi:MAG: 16S rRNA (cytosine(1402)-N(4))-methyltransferase RsmH [Oscillospiraceae bacterium]|jgi:16S rRNA (cytosine1402-N4)-methyltransferase|nr:16S rRNA (cytosine(1402)-N(4))-methyltransferase RsmH [Oscillospiraceae bacterium]